MTFVLQLLGGFSLRRPGEAPVSIRAKKARALLTWLALHSRQPQSRARLAALLWTDSDDAAARHNLRQSLANLRKSLGSDVLQSDRDAVRLDVAALDVDVHSFERHAAARSNGALEQACALYRGALLEGFAVRAPAFEEWLAAERARLHEQAIDAMTTLLDRYVAAGDTELAMPLANRLLVLDPVRESVHRVLMQMQASRGQYGSAMRQYRRCVAVLARELDVQPEPATRELYRRIARSREHAGAPLDGEDAPPDAAATEPDEMQRFAAPSTDALAPQRRQAAILGVQLADFAHLAASVEPEQAHAHLLSFYAAVEQCVARFQGHIASRSAQTIWAIFGAVRARSNDLERAIHCAGAVHAALAQVKTDTGNEAGACCAVTSGGVLVSRTQGATQMTLTGEPVDECAALLTRTLTAQTLTTPGAVEGLAGRVDARPVDGAPPALAVVETRPERAARSAFVGRVHERRLFESALASSVDERRGQVFLLRGEAGIGKTRLLEEWRTLAHAAGFGSVVARALDFGAAIGQDVVPMLVRELLSIAHDASVESRRKVLAELCATDTAIAGDEVFLHDLLDVPLPDRLRTHYAAMDNATRQQGRKRTILHLLQARSVREPLLIAVEDIHWADAETLTLLAHIACAVDELATILVLSTRTASEPDDPRWRAALVDVAMTTFDMQPLREAEARALATALVGRDAGFIDRCIARAAGNPLFLEQLLGAAASGDEAVPDSVQSIVSARLDRLVRSDRLALQAASTLGQRFSLEALRHLIDSATYDAAALLVERLLRPGADSLRFAHALVHEGVYGTLLESQRRSLHRRAAAWYAPRDARLHAEQLERAGDPGAAQAYQRAAHEQASVYRYELARQLIERARALERDPVALGEIEAQRGDILRESGVIDESVTAFEAALERATTPAARCRSLLGIAAGLRVMNQFERALSVLTDAEALADELGDPDTLARVHHLRGNVLFPVGQFDVCRQAHERAAEWARRAGSPELEARALSGLGDAEYQCGRILTAYTHFDRCVALCRRHRLAQIEAANLAMRGSVLGRRLRFGEAIEDLTEAAAIAAQVGNPRDRCLALMGLVGVLLISGDIDAVREPSRECIALTRKLGAPYFEALALADQAAADALCGDLATAQAKLTHAYDLCQGPGLGLAGPTILGVTAWVTRDAAQRDSVLAQGEALLAAGSVSHNHFNFRAWAAEACMDAGRWDDAQRQADGLAAHTRPEPYPASEFVVAYIRARVRAARGERSSELRDEIRRLRALAHKCPMPAFAGKLDAATATVESRA